MFPVEAEGVPCSMPPTVPEPLNFDSDFLFAEACLAEDAEAIGRLRRMLDGQISSYLVKVGVSLEDASQISSDLIADLLANSNGRKPLLRRFTGQCALPTWLNRVALNRWISARRKSPEVVEIQNDAAIQSAREPSSRLLPDDEPLIPLLRDAFCCAIAGLDAEDFVLFQLLHREGLRQTEVAVMFGHNRRSIAKRAERIAADLRAAIMDYLRTNALDLELEWKDVIELCSSASSDVIAPE